MHRRTLAAAAVLATAVCSTLPLLGGTASAATTTRPLLVVSTDTDGDGGHGLYATDSLGRHTLVPESDTTDVYAMTTSRDGSRIAYLQDVYDSAGNLTHERLVVRDTSTAATPGFSRVVSDLTPASGDVLDFFPSLSPDGSTVVWSRIDFNANIPVVSLMSAPVAAGAAAKVADGVSGAAFLDSQTLIGSTDSAVVTLPVAGGTQSPVAGLTTDDGQFAASPDGTHVAWMRDTSPAAGNTFTAEVHVADVALASGVATLSADRKLASGVDALAPAWNADGSQVLYVVDDVNGNGSVYSAPQDASAPATTFATPAGDTVGVGYAVTDATAPASATMLPATLAGTAATVRWSLPSDADVYGVELTRTAAGTATKVATVPTPATSYKDSGLVLGKTYTYSAVVVDRSGNRSAGVTRQLTALGATATFPDPTSTTYFTSPAFRVYFPTPGTYTVQYRTNGTGSLTTWVNNASASSQVFSAAKAGSSYGLLMTRYDGFGNSTAATGLGTAVVPYDQTRASFTGSTATQALSGRYLGSATILKAAGAAARLVVNGNRLQVIGEKCASCGVMDIYVDGTRVAGVDTHDTQRRARAVLYTRNLTAGVNHTVVIKARGTAGRPNVVLDAFGVRH
ncbi:MAG: hypothetical protein JWO27_657 [Frankiales bacterium]|nr:hypothetical protein [Frankiales bacterium]